jgi:molecular chaperone GrpE
MPSSPVSDDGREHAHDEPRGETMTEAAQGAAQAADQGGAQPQRSEDRDLEAELARSEDRYRRALADLDNYRKRAAQEVQRQVAEGGERILLGWLDAVDSVDRALRMPAPENELAAGLRAVLEQMEAILERQGVERIGAPGEPFDPERHEAIAVRETDSVPDRTIIEVARSGYRIGDRVLRPAQVVVARRGDGGSPQRGEGGSPEEEGGSREEEVED